MFSLVSLYFMFLLFHNSILCTIYLLTRCNIIVNLFLHALENLSLSFFSLAIRNLRSSCSKCIPFEVTGSKYGILGVHASYSLFDGHCID